MEYSRVVEEELPVECLIVVDSKSLKNVLEIAKRHFRNIPRIPNVIHVDKEYKAFRLMHEYLQGSIIVLIKSESKLENVSSTKIILTLDYFTYTEILDKLIGKDLSLHSYEVVGNIIHLNLSQEQLEHKRLIGTILNYKTGLTVINKTGKIDTTYRFYDLEVLCGQDNLETVHKENGVSIIVDLRSVYWCSRLQAERSNILDNFESSQSLCDPFCGVGPLVLPALKKGLKVYANDLNPSAIACLKKSLSLNKLQCNEVYCGDAAEFITSVKSKRIDHIVFNLPEYSLDYIKYLKDFLSHSTRLHCFFFCKDNILPEEEVLFKTGVTVKAKYLRYVRKVSPSKSVYKLECKLSDLFVDLSNNEL